jgi:acyl-coenzyme A synthetase/AMP-(fatty) acid ligase
MNASTMLPTQGFDYELRFQSLFDPAADTRFLATLRVLWICHHGHTVFGDQPDGQPLLGYPAAGHQPACEPALRGFERADVRPGPGWDHAIDATLKET